MAEFFIVPPEKKAAIDAVTAARKEAGETSFLTCSELADGTCVLGASALTATGAGQAFEDYAACLEGLETREVGPGDWPQVEGP